MPQAPRRILVLDHTAALGGAEIALERLLGALDPGRFAVQVVTFADGPLVGRLIAAGHSVDVLPLSEDLAGRERTALVGGVRSAVGTAASAGAFVRRLRRLIKDRDADLVVTNSLKSSVLGGAAARLSGRPWVWHLHDRLSPDYLPGPVAGAMVMLARLGPRLVVANSRASAAALGRRTAAASVVAYPGLPATAFRSPRVPVVRPRVGIVGRISATKGQLEFLRAAGRVVTTHPDVEFVVVGAALFNDASYEERVHAEMSALGLDGRVRFTGWIPDPAEEIDGLTVLVHASPVPEPFGQVIVEGMAREVPVIATSGGGVDEILIPGGSGAELAPGQVLRTSVGQLVPPGDVSSLADAIRFAVDHPVETQERAAAALERARVEFGIERTAAVITEAWERTARR